MQGAREEDIVRHFGRTSPRPCKAAQALAFLKCLPTDCRQTGWNLHMRQADTLIKSKTLNLLHAFRNDDVFQLGAVIERACTDLLEPGGEHYTLEHFMVIHQCRRNLLNCIGHDEFGRIHWHEPQTLALLGVNRLCQ